MLHAGTSHAEYGIAHPVKEASEEDMMGQLCEAANPAETSPQKGDVKRRACFKMGELVVLTPEGRTHPELHEVAI